MRGKTVSGRSRLALSAILLLVSAACGQPAAAERRTVVPSEPPLQTAIPPSATSAPSPGATDLRRCRTGSGPPRRGGYRRLQPRGRYSDCGDPRQAPGRHGADARGQRLRQGDTAPVRLLPRHVGRRARAHSPGPRWTRLHDRGSGRLLRVLRRRPRAIRAHRDRPDDGLVCLRPRPVAGHRPQLDLRPDRGLRRRLTAGRLAPGGARWRTRRRAHWQSSTTRDSARAARRTNPGSARSGRSSTRPVSRWS